MLFRSFRRILFTSIRTMRIVPIPAFQDNYMYLIVADQGAAAIVDPVDVESIHAAVKVQGAVLEQALVTHHHADHASGTSALAGAKSTFGQSMRDLRIYGGDGERIADIDVVLQDNQQIKLGNLNIQAMRTPCHTSTHICYFVTDAEKGQRAVFTGDTLFIGGCGRFFEGTAEQMNYALNERLGTLPDDTEVYCGHEYTVQNLKFALSVEPDNAAVKQKLQQSEAQRAKGQFTVPSTIGQEKEFNPFMRVQNPKIQQIRGTPNDPIGTMAKLREMKNNFRG